MANCNIIIKQQQGFYQNRGIASSPDYRLTEVYMKRLYAWTEEVEPLALNEAL